MKQMFVTFAVLILSLAAVAQTAANPNPFPSTSMTFSLSPITLPGLKSSVAGAETDIMVSPSNTFSVGETNLTSSSMIFAGGRGEYGIKAISDFIQNHSPNLNGYQFQFKLVGSVGVVKPVGSLGSPHWGERAGIAVNYAVNGNWGMGLDAEWGNFPGVAHNTWTLAFGPNVHF